jgi:hypothetical protein
MTMTKSVVAEVYLGFMASCYAGDSFLASATFIDFRISPRRLYCPQKTLRASEPSHSCFGTQFRSGEGQMAAIKVRGAAIPPQATSQTRDRSELHAISEPARV